MAYSNYINDTGNSQFKRFSFFSTISIKTVTQFLLIFLCVVYPWEWGITDLDYWMHNITIPIIIWIFSSFVVVRSLRLWQKALRPLAQMRVEQTASVRL